MSWHDLLAGCLFGAPIGLAIGLMLARRRK